ncbi:MAG: hypothetical protein J6I50_02660 [Clostridia bacterium]|nr:hypothetical protein [Clostridia bacterium]
MQQNYRRLVAACYTTNLSQSVVASLSPVLFLTFRSLYGVSYALLGLLVLINFIMQLTIDLIFSFFSQKFNITKTVHITPLLTAIGLLVYAVWPFFFPGSVYTGLVIGTIIFSMSGGLAEVLISPVIASIPSENPDHEMSKLHSIYAWGVVGVILISTLWILVFGQAAWQWLALFFALIPMTACILYYKTELPPMETGEQGSKAPALMKSKTL